MGVSKIDKFSESQNQLASLAKVLGHPARIAILQELFKRDSCICGDLVSEIGLAQATISQHLRELKNAGLIKGTIDGTSVCYCINLETWKTLKGVLSDFLDQDITCSSECC